MTPSEFPRAAGLVPAGFERDPYLRSLETLVVSTGEDGGRPYAVLADTILFPEGGGQPADRGSLGEVEVVDVQRSGAAGTEVRHFLAVPVSVGPAMLRLDWSRRYDLMQQHTAQHLLSAIAADRFGWPTTSFHLGAEVCDVELDVPVLDPQQLAALEDAVAAEVRAARTVSARRVSRAEYEALGARVRSRGLPDGFAGDVRLVEIDGVDLNTCGGTHLRSTAEIEALKLLGTERLRGGTRLFWAAGARVRRRLGRREHQAAELRATLGASDDELLEQARLKVQRLEQADRARRVLLEELAAATAATLLAAPQRVLARHFPDRDAGFVQGVGRAFAAASGCRYVLLTAGPEGAQAFVLAATTDGEADLRPLGQRVAAALQGRGGGSGRVFQGKAGSLARLGEAVALLEGAAAERPSPS